LFFLLAFSNNSNQSQRQYP